MNCKYLIFLIGLTIISTSYGHPCDKMSDDMKKSRNRNEIGKYIIVISGDPEFYIPNEIYDISLEFNEHYSMNNSLVRRFRDFILSIEYDNVPNALEDAEVIRLQDLSLTKFSATCRNTVIQTNSLSKEKIKVKWIAPPVHSGCITIKAVVVESKDNWYAEDGDLTKRLCEELSENENVQPLVRETCCACDEAKYELAFESVWSRNTHPKKFPNDVWKTKLSDVIGASHKFGNSFWNYNSIASEGLKDFAEAGSMKGLESELKSMSENIRTIIMARGLSHPNLIGTTYTVFRVDDKNHLVSLVSKITPSPDWIVGVSNFELCLPNCSWVESRTLNLYPWDVGTNDGIDYLTKGASTYPQDEIKRITSNSPNDTESPFYDETEEIKPIAKIHFTLQKLYGKKCAISLESEDNNNENNNYRYNYYENNNENNNNNDNRHESNEFCGNGPCINKDSTRTNGTQCEMTDFGEWSSCSVTCGKGTRTRDRKFIHPMFQGLCSRYNPPELQENQVCDTGKTCNEQENPSVVNDNCPPWGEWTTCSVTCGEGIKERFRESLNDEENDNLTCNSEKVICYETPCTGTEETEAPFGEIQPENQLNNLPLVVTEGPDGPVTDCKVSKWSTWSICNVSEPCKKGYQFKSRHIILHSQNGGRPCPKKLQKKKKCRGPCNKDDDDDNNDDSRELLPTWGPGQRNEDIIIDCVMSAWSAWSPCTTICGPAVQLRTRQILQNPTRNGRPCPPRDESRKCPIPVSCEGRSILP